MRKEEGGQRASINCVVTDKDNKLKKFHPLLVVSEDWENWFIDQYNIELCKLYNPPYNFKRTGCKGCPFSLDLQNQLDVMKKLLPNEYNQCELIWKPVYDEYRRINYRLRNQMTIYDFIDEE
jgi:3'-phosphoadenosine 5'-phosphosulfate sulfotransferase (PAPS reductase)/FAD synthetase